MCFVLFECIWYRLVALQNSVQNRLKCCKSLCHGVVSEFFTTNHSIHPIGFYPHVSVHFVLFYAFGTVCCVTTFSSKRAKLVQKFVPRSRVGIFHNECTRSTPLDPKLTFLCVSYYLGEFGTVWLPYETRCKTGQTSAKVRATKSLQNYSQ